jgi:hypothetical protein
VDHVEITPKEVLTAINQLKLKKASDINGLSSEHLKYGGLKLIETLVALFNKILDSAIYPDAFNSFSARHFFKFAYPKMPGFLAVSCLF